MNKIVIGMLGFLLGASTAAVADVTIEQNTTLTALQLVHLHGKITELVSNDKQRNDTETHCEGIMSLVCGNLGGGEIIRLDRDLTWQLEPSKKRYREQPFATPEQLAEMRARMQANLEKMRACPTPKGQPAEDKSKCEMSPPKFDVHKTGEQAMIAGHSSQHTLASVTETCTNKETGDVCDTVVALDLWLTQDILPGTEERNAFAKAYVKKLGLDMEQGPMRDTVNKFLGQYQPQMQQLMAKSGDLKGQPMRTSFRMLTGGPKCSTANNTANDNKSAEPNPAAEIKESVGQLLGMFGKKKSDDSKAPPSATPPRDKAKDPFGNLVELGEFTIETVSVSTDSIPAERFEVPRDWKKELPKAEKNGDDKFTCPKTSG